MCLVARYTLLNQSSAVSHSSLHLVLFRSFVVTFTPISLATRNVLYLYLNCKIVSENGQSTKL